MRIMSMGHPAVTVGSRLVVFDIDTFQARGGVVSDGSILAEGGIAEVPDEIGQILIASQCGMRIDQPEDTQVPGDAEGEQEPAPPEEPGTPAPPPDVAPEPDAESKSSYAPRRHRS